MTRLLFNSATRCSLNSVNVSLFPVIWVLSLMNYAVIKFLLCFTRFVQALIQIIVVGFLLKDSHTPELAGS